MERSEEIYYELYFERLNSLELIAQCENPIKDYLHLLGSAPILEIGIGVGADVLFLANKGKKLICVEKEQNIIKQISDRILGCKLEKGAELDILLFKQEFPNLNLPFTEFSFINLSNMLHFFDYPTANQSIENLKQKISSKGYLYIKAHSKNHPFNKNPNFYPTYRHFFTEVELSSMFSSNYQVIECGEKINFPTQVEMEIKSEWIERYWVEFCKGKNNLSIEQLRILNPINDPEVSIDLLVQRND